MSIFESDEVEKNHEKAKKVVSSLQAAMEGHDLTVGVAIYCATVLLANVIGRSDDCPLEGRIQLAMNVAGSLVTMVADIGQQSDELAKMGKKAQREMMQ